MRSCDLDYRDPKFSEVRVSLVDAKHKDLDMSFESAAESILVWTFGVPFLTQVDFEFLKTGGI